MSKDFRGAEDDNDDDDDNSFNYSVLLHGGFDLGDRLQ